MDYGTSSVVSKRDHRTDTNDMVQNFLLVWLDTKIDESSDDYLNCIKQLRQTFNTIEIFRDTDECIDYISELQNEKVFLIISGTLCKTVVPLIHNMVQLYSIYVFCRKEEQYEAWTKDWSKVKGMFTEITPISDSVQQWARQCDEDSTVISAVSSLNQIEPSFMYTQLFKEIIIEIDFDEKKEITDLAEYAQAPFRAINEIHGATTTFTVYRGQVMIKEDFENKIKQGGLISFNNFLSTSDDRKVALRFIPKGSQSTDDNTIRVLFEMAINRSISSAPFARIDKFSYFKTEKEILFSMHSVFRVQQVTEIEDSGIRLCQVKLTLTTENDDEQLNALTRRMREEIDGTGWERMGRLLEKLGESDKAEQLYTMLLKQISNEISRATCYNNLGVLKNSQGKYNDAVEFYQKALHIREKTFSPNHPGLAASYNNIGAVYHNMGEYSKALSSYERSLEIRKIALPPNHPDLASSYNNIGLVYNNMGEYSKALSSYERSLEIRKIALPPNHPDLASSYNNIGAVYDNMGEYLKALSSYERSLEITKIALPPNHPTLASSYNNIGAVYHNMGEYSKALSWYERSLEIKKIALPPNHPDLASSYNNIGLVYNNMGEYLKALSSYERSLEIKKIALPPNHPDLASSYNNIGLVYNNMGEYSKALSSYERSLEIQKIALPPNHPDLASSYLNIGLVYSNMGEYSKALSNYEKAQEIFEKSLPPTHPHIALVKGNIEIVKKKM
ncbi:unnamed protein product [Rotaria sp. Silwood2]|nr:unnamed protein product [Rotaria sp. Silwood2]